MIEDENRAKIRDVFDMAYELFYKYDLNGWAFLFDNAKSRAGLCNYDKKTISLSRNYVKVASSGEIENAILHEIAHAIVGYSHGHDNVWKAKALEIGCNGQRCHTLHFVVAKWIMRCPNGCFKTLRQRKNKLLVCKSCKIPVVYLPNNV